MIPTIRQVCRAYPLFAAAERMKTERPSETTVENTLSGVTLVYRAAGIADDAPVTAFTRQALNTALVAFLDRGISRLSALTYLQQLQALFARWTKPYFEDSGWELPNLELPTFRAVAPRYERPTPDLLRRLKNWYLLLTAEFDSDYAAGRRVNATASLWLAATMMLEFAMRNSDILRLRRENFIEHEGRIYLNYTPHKTMHSSGRVVRWPVHADLWRRIRDIAFDCDETTFEELNRAMRALGFTGSKGAYELRKICIDHVYQRFGAEMAVSISGDNIKTIIHYYADPSQPNIGDVRITDLL